MDVWPRKAAPEEEESFMHILHSRMETSSAHGLPNIQRASRPLTKLMWLTLFLAGIGVIGWQVLTLFQEYLKYDYVVSLEIKFNRSQAFPAITVCNMNPVMKTKMEGSDDSFRQLFDVNFSPPKHDNAANQQMAASVLGAGVVASEVVTGVAGGTGQSGGVPDETSEGPTPNTTARDLAAASTTVGTSVLGNRRSQPSAITASTPYPTSTGNEGTTTGSTSPSAGQAIETSTTIIESWNERQKGDFFKKQSDDYMQQRRLTTQLANKTLEERMALGHSLDEMLFSCSWRGYPCSPANFTPIYDPKFGNCYTFNSGESGSTLTTNRPGPSYGLSLELYAQQAEYMDELTEVAGFRVVIHHPNTMPFPTDDGIFVSPGLATAIGVRVLEIERLPQPYGDCREDVLTGIEKNIYYQNYGVSYSLQTCEQSCYQWVVIRECGCTDPTYPTPLDGNQTHLPCDIDDEIETECIEDMERKYNNDELGCVCKNACNDITYLPTISSSIWPSDGYEKKLFQRMRESNEEMKKMMRVTTPSDWTRSNMAKLEVYFQEFNYEYVKQDPAYTLLDLLSDMGGQLGLWLGLSVVTVFEIFEGIWMMVAFLCRRKKATLIEPIQTGIQTGKSQQAPPPSYTSTFPTQE